MRIDSIFTHWHWIRFLRLLLGLSIVAQGLQWSRWSFIVAGIILTILPVLNIGCCSTGGCHTSPREKGKQKSMDDVMYEEIK